MLAHKAAGGQVVDLLAVDRGVKGEVKAFQRLGGGDAAAPDAEREMLLGPALDLILHQPSEELLVGPLLTNRLLCPDLQGRQDATEAQPFELGGELGDDHRTAPQSWLPKSLACRTKV